MQRSLRRIDVIVVAGFLLLLLAWLSPLVLRARADARRMQCASNMRQVGLGFIQYLNTKTHFPPSEYTANGWSGTLDVIPYIESCCPEDPITWDRSRPRWAPENSQVAAVEIALLRCPSNPHTAPVPASEVTRLDGSQDPGSNRYAMSHYAVNWGGGRGPWGKTFTTVEGAYRGVMRPDVVAKIPLKPITEADVTDGMSTTLLLTEKRNSQGWPVGGWAGSEFDVGTSPAMKVNDGWGDYVYSGSYHRGGVNAVFCDGSAHFLTSTMNPKLWFALITRDGGEPVEESSGPDAFLLAK